MAPGCPQRDHAREFAGRQTLEWTDPLTSESFVIVITFIDVGGRAEPSEVTVKSNLAQGLGIVSGAALRRIPFSRLIAEARTAHLTMNKHLAESMEATERGEQVLATARLFAPRRGKALTSEVLETVAQVYREAYRVGKNPVQAVADAMQLSPSTASKRVIAARRLGYLGPAQRGRAGEAP
jgi:hypothetical protein